MLKFIAKLQKKPESERKRILIASTAAITLIIFAFWLASFRNLLTQSPENKKTVETTPFSVLKNNLGSAYDGIMNSFQPAIPADQSATTTNGQQIGEE